MSSPARAVTAATLVGVAGQGLASVRRGNAATALGVVDASAAAAAPWPSSSAVVVDAPRPLALPREVPKAVAAEAPPREVTGGDTVPRREALEAATIGVCRKLPWSDASFPGACHMTLPRPLWLRRLMGMLGEHALPPISVRRGRTARRPQSLVGG